MIETKYGTLLRNHTITLALVFYTIGVWSEKVQGELRPWHLAVFWVGFAFDTTGTTLMSRLAPNGFQLNFHGVTGLIAIVLMLLHVLWATVVISRNRPEEKRNFHRFSLVVWIIWLIPFISGAAFGMAR
jgi:uncharacterized repeat protein (TIGR03987 family)